MHWLTLFNETKDMGEMLAMVHCSHDGWDSIIILVFQQQPSSEVCCEGCVVTETEQLHSPGWESCVLSPPGSPLSRHTKVL